MSTTCKDGSEFQLYYSKNSYSTVDNYEQENYYDIVTVIMDQLINYGPVASSIDCYSDLYSLKGGESCFQTIPHMTLSSKLWKILKIPNYFKLSKI